MRLPNGVSANAANLKCCMPNGMPMMVIHSTMPKPRWDRLIQIPPKNIHKIFMVNERQPPELGQLITFFPNGIRASILIFNVCRPKGMPIMVIIISKLAIKYSMQVNIPPSSSHMMFINRFI